MRTNHDVQARPPDRPVAISLPSEAAPDRFLTALLGGDHAGAEVVVMSALGIGWSRHDVYVRVVQEALYEVGRTWERSELSVAQEDLGTCASGDRGAPSASIATTPRPPAPASARRSEPDATLAAMSRLDSELDDLRRALAENNAELARVHAQLNRLMGIAAHDPLAVIVRNSQRMREGLGNPLDAEQQEMLEAIEASGWFKAPARRHARRRADPRRKADLEPRTDRPGRARAQADEARRAGGPSRADRATGHRFGGAHSDRG